jgi:hypothetical protein
MDFFKIKRLGKGTKSPRGKGEVVESEDGASAGNAAPAEEQQKDGAAEGRAEAVEAVGGGDGAVEGGREDEEEEEEDDFIANEVKRRLKEMRKNSFMVLIPEEECTEVEEDGEEDVGEEEGSSSREWLESDIVDGFPLYGFDSLYEKYCQRMLVFDKMFLQLMKDPGKRYLLSGYYFFLSYMLVFLVCCRYSAVCAILVT